MDLKLGILNLPTSTGIKYKIQKKNKILKSIENPKLRPIISQVTTPTCNLSKYLKHIISPYMPRKHVLASTYEFLDIIRAAETSSGIMVSLDVESLFTNVPVEETIKIVLDNVYDHSEMAPPKIPPNLLQEMPLVSPTGQIYLQKDGCTLCIHPIVHCTMGWMHNGHESNWNWLGNGCTMGMIVSGTNLG